MISSDSSNMDIDTSDLYDSDDPDDNSNPEDIIISDDDDNPEDIIMSDEDDNSEDIITSDDDDNSEDIITSDDDDNPEGIIISDDDDDPESKDEVGPGDVDEDAQIDAVDDTAIEERVTQPLPAEDGIDVLRASRVVRHVVKNPSVENRTAFNAGSAAIFAYLCRILQVEHDGIQMGKKESKCLLFHALCHAVNSSAIWAAL